MLIKKHDTKNIHKMYDTWTITIKNKIKDI